jgi:hypothetical protein
MNVLRSGPAALAPATNALLVARASGKTKSSSDFPKGGRWPACLQFCLDKFQPALLGFGWLSHIIQMDSIWPRVCQDAITGCSSRTGLDKRLVCQQLLFIK